MEIKSIFPKRDSKNIDTALLVSDVCMFALQEVHIT